MGLARLGAYSRGDLVHRDVLQIGMITRHFALLLSKTSPTIGRVKAEVLRCRRPAAVCAPTPGQGWFSGRCEPHPETNTPYSTPCCFASALTLSNSSRVRNRRLLRRIGLRVARTRVPANSTASRCHQPVWCSTGCHSISNSSFNIRCASTPRNAQPPSRHLGGHDMIPFLSLRTQGHLTTFSSSTPLRCSPLARPVTQSLKPSSS